MVKDKKTEYADFAAKGLKLIYELSLVKKVLSKEAYKNYGANAVYRSVLRKDKEGTDLFKRFKSAFPDCDKNKYLRKLFPSIDHS